jgi:two-component system, cell cycle sensor histidine kinase and response regulator CckA
MLLWGSSANGQAQVPDATNLPLIVHASEVYGMEGAAREKRYRFSVNAIVSYYDPTEFQFYGVDGGKTFYMAPTTGQRFAIKPGQLVRLTGEVVPERGFKAEKLQIGVLAEADPRIVISAHHRLDDNVALDAHLIEVDGLVDWQEQLDPNHQRLSLIVEGHRLNTTLLLGESDQAPLLTGAIVHVLGMYLAHLDINKHLASIELRVQGAENVHALGWIYKDPRFDQPTTRIVDMQQVSPETWVHVAGRVDSFLPGRTVTIRDSTGLLELNTPQERGLHVGAEIDAIGYRSSRGGEASVDQALWRPLGSSAPSPSITSSRSTLNLAAQILELPLEKAAAQQSVQLSGVVTWGAEGDRSFFLQDRSGGLRVTVDPKVEFSGNPIGLGAEIRGVSAMGNFAPEVIATWVRLGTAMSPPEPQRISLEMAQTGASEGRWVEMEGYVRAVETTKLWTQLDLTTPTGEFRATMPLGAKVENLVGAFVRIRGVCSASANEFRRSTGVQLWVPLDENIDVDDAPVKEPFSIPFTPLESLGRFGSELSIARRIHTGGTVTYQAPGRYLVLQKGSARLTVLSRNLTAFDPGDQVDVVGIPGWDARRFILREAVARKIGHDKDLLPVRLPTLVPLTGSFESLLVQLDGILTDVTNVGDEFFLSIRKGDRTIVARLAHAQNVRLPESWLQGSNVVATGLSRVRLDENRQGTGLELLLRTPADIVITRSAPWWTVKRALVAAGLLGAFSAIFALWLVSLRRRVNRQTEQIRRQMEKQSKLEAELERAQRLHSLGLLAGGIAHDFNNLLTVIIGNLTLAMLDEVVVARAGDLLREAGHGSNRAKALTQQLLTFAKGGDPVREAFSLPAVVNEAAHLALSGAKSRTDFRSPPDLWAVDADRAQIGQAVGNLVSFANAAMPDGGVIEITAANESVADDGKVPLATGRYVLLTVSDHGKGIPAGQMAGIFDPYAAVELGKQQFGLATTYSIMKRHGGLVSVSSPEGQGTTFRLWIPASDSAPAQAIDTSQSRAKAPKRVLLMDDEATIRTLGKRMLERINCEVTTAGDGAECVRAYMAARSSGRAFDFVILDLTVPGGMGGAEAIVELRKIDPEVRAIVSSGYSNDPVMAHFADYGFCAVVPKPYDCKMLVAVLESLG